METYSQQRRTRQAYQLVFQIYKISPITEKLRVNLQAETLQAQVNTLLQQT